ncbi:MAG: hypothetical protein M1837_007051 [Sclerophora amabilis]|nr:MAG: hypothetical protein M1837_007051 [Sclerophora amabilis]
MTRKHLGLRTRVLTLQWPEGVQPSALPDFESQARRLRYQALGRACREHSITSLFLAHHEDDQAETVLMRIASGHNGAGLQGIKSRADIPECFGIHGVHQSGGSDQLSSRGRRRERQRDPKLSMETPFSIESGGVKIYRPLLGFSKRCLVSICASRDKRWIEDETNRDPTITQRNAVRQILERHRLPRALRKPNLLSLARDAMMRNEADSAMVEQYFNHCKMLVFDIRSGSVVMRFPKTLIPPIHEIPVESLSKTLDAARYRAACIIRRVMELVSPLGGIDLSRLKKAVEIIFPDLDDDSPWVVEDARVFQTTSFTACGVMVGRQEYKSARTGPVDSPDDPPNPSQPIGGVRLEEDPEYAWTFTRQPFMSSDSSTATNLTIIIPPATPGLHSKDDATISSTSSRDTPSSSPWHLWDGRFWLHVDNRTRSSLTIRPLRESDLKPFRLALSPKSRRQLQQRLSDAAPDKVRWTLPAIANERDEVIALPTLNVNRDRDQETQDVDYTVRYKSVDLGSGGQGE